MVQNDNPAFCFSFHSFKVLMPVRYLLKKGQPQKRAREWKRAVSCTARSNTSPWRGHHWQQDIKIDWDRRREGCVRKVITCNRHLRNGNEKMIYFYFTSLQWSSLHECKNPKDQMHKDLKNSSHLFAIGQTRKWNFLTLWRMDLTELNRREGHKK